MVKWIWISPKHGYSLLLVLSPRKNGKWTNNREPELQIQSLSKSEHHEQIPDWLSLSMIKYTLVNKPKRALIFLSHRITGTHTVPAQASPSVLSCYSTHHATSWSVPWCGSQYSSSAGAGPRTEMAVFSDNLPHPVSPFYPLSTSDSFPKVCRMKTSPPLAMHCT